MHFLFYILVESVKHNLSVVTKLLIYRYVEIIIWVAKCSNSLGSWVFVLSLWHIDKPGCFESTLDTCAAPLYTCTGNSGIITSPHYPLPTMVPTDCVWHVYTPPDSFVRLRLSNASFQSYGTPCNKASVKIIEDTLDMDGIIIGEYCSDYLPKPDTSVESSLNYVRIELQVSSDGKLELMIEYEAAHFANQTHGNYGYYLYLLFIQLGLFLGRGTLI